MDSELIPFSPLLAHTAFALPNELFLSQSTTSGTFIFLILSPIPPGKNE